MSGLFATLGASVKGLTAQTRGLETAGKNLANVNNANYARQRVVFGDRGEVITPDGPSSLGIEALSVTQMRDTMLDQQVSREIGLSSKLDTLQSALDTAQAGLGQSISSSSSTSAGTGTQGLAENLNAFFNSWTSLAATPTDVGVRQTLLQNAQVLAQRFNLTDTRLSQNQSDLSDQIKSNVTSANDILKTIADLNGQISRFEINNPGSAVDLRDQRQGKLEELAKIMDFTVSDDSTYKGEIVVTAKDSSGSAVNMVQHSSYGTLSTDSSVTAVSLVAASSSTSSTLTISSGSIAGAFTARDTQIANLRTQLNDLAHQIVTSVNSAYGGSFFQSSGTTAGTIAVDTSLTASSISAGSGASGDNSIAAAISALSTNSFSTTSGDYIDGTFSQFYNQSVSGLGQALSSAKTQLTDQQAVQKMVTSQRDAVSGVSMDEEMADLTKYQRAYQASARVFSTVNELLDNVVNSMGK